MPAYQGSGTENLRAHEQTPASSVPAAGGTGGTSVGGTANLRATYTAPEPAKPAAAPNPGRSTQGTTFTDNKV